MTDPLAALDALTRAVGDFVWLVHLRQSGSCYLCGAGEGIAHDPDKACGEVQVAHTAALAVLHHQPPAPAEGLREAACEHTTEWIASRWEMVRADERRFWQRLLLAYGNHTDDCDTLTGCSCAWSGYMAAARAALKEPTDDR